MTTDLTVAAFNAFAQDISAMFDTAVSVEQLDIAAGTTKQFTNTYKKLAAVCSVKARGALNGRFHVVFGTEGLFTLAGTFAMQPEQIIKENRKGGTETDANEIADAVVEISNLIVEAWDRVFREEMPDHKHFVQSGTFIGNPWIKSEEKIGLAADTELVILTFEMTIDPLPAFKCAVIYPKSLFEPPTDEAGADAEADDEETPAREAPADEVAAKPAAAESAADDEAGTEQASATEAPTEEAAEDKAGAEGSAEETATPDATPQEPSSEESGTDQAATEGSATEQAQSGPETTAEESEQPAQAQEDSAQQEPSSEEQPPEAQDEQQEASGQPQPEESQAGAVTDAIAKMTRSAAVLPGRFTDSAAILMGLTAKDVMTANVVWAAPDETVEQLTAKMQQHDTAYLLIGEKAQLEGIVSKSDVRGALSPYLQSMFAKWRTSMDIATLQIKAQWIMSRPVRTVRGEATLAQVVQGMSEHGSRCMPVTDEQGKVHGIVTVFDIFSALLTCASGVSTAGKTAEAPPLV